MTAKIIIKEMTEQLERLFRVTTNKKLWTVDTVLEVMQVCDIIT